MLNFYRCLSVQEFDQNSRFITRMDEFTGQTTCSPVFGPGCTPLPLVLRCVERCPSGWPPRCPGSSLLGQVTCVDRRCPQRSSSCAAYSCSEEGTCRTRHVSEQSLVIQHKILYNVDQGLVTLLRHSRTVSTKYKNDDTETQ